VEVRQLALVGLGAALLDFVDDLAQFVATRDRVLNLAEDFCQSCT
jgi:hypothetical protein